MEMFSVLVASTKKRYSSFFKKGFRFPESLFQSCPENVQNFRWLSHKPMPISQTACYFENPSHRFLEEPIALSVCFKMKTLKRFRILRQKKTSKFCLKLLKEVTIYFYSLFDKSRFSDIYLYDNGIKKNLH